MIEPNWDIFKAKFSNNPQKAFEWLCYILFCKEFGEDKGVFRFKNQGGMETNPVCVEGKWTAHEAKFFTTEDKLADNIGEFKGKIDVTAAKNPEVTKLIFYTPIDWTESRKQNVRKTKKQMEVEAYGSSKDIEVEWKGLSFFESPFVCIQNADIVEHFFSLDGSLFDFLAEQELHTEGILKPIKASLTFGGTNIEVDRNQLIQKVNVVDNQVIVVSGVGGVGKTAVVKKLYEEHKGETPFYLFKSTEFELRDLGDFSSNFDIRKFVKVHGSDELKFVAIDSAEKLLELKNIDPFQEFFTLLLENGWKVIFTARESYLEGLNYQLFEVFNVAPFYLNIINLTPEGLSELSKKNSFVLPKDQKLLNLIRNPFYLGEYLKFHTSGDQIDYTGFKTVLWNKNVKKTKPARAECFLKIARIRADEGIFFINPPCEHSILDDHLLKDGILGYEEDRGYFITHDIYEEWALEKIIERAFTERETVAAFFSTIGQSLPMCRSFRNWVSEKLLLESKEVESFISEAIFDGGLDESWRREMLVAILLSDYADYFFGHFKAALLKDEQGLLKNAAFWLQIACKEVDEELLARLGLGRTDLSVLQQILTKPKGRGWHSLIKFVYDNLDAIGVENISFVFPVINDWSKQFKRGETTKYASLIALKYYQWMVRNDVHFSYQDDGFKNKLLRTILNGAEEIKDELVEILTLVVENSWKDHRDPYYDLSHTVLTSFDAVPAYHVMPTQILHLAALFWMRKPKEEKWSSSSDIGLEKYFEIESDHLDYFPTSSFQTPIYWLLQFSFKETVDFILTFSNQTVEHFASSEFAKHEVEQVSVYLNGGNKIQQYISTRLWCIYRGTQTAPDVLESMHMALEKFLLDQAKNLDSETLEKWLLYLLQRSRSASISAVVSSIVTAFPDKTFNVAIVLFKTKEFFLYDTSRLVLDQGHTGGLQMLQRSWGINYKNKVHEDERIAASELPHRKMHLESIFFNYQVFRSENVTEKEVEERRVILWAVLDDYYRELPQESEQNDFDETWRLFLARMDYRKMTPTTKETEGGIEIHWNPEVAPELKKRSEASSRKSAKMTEYIELKLWATYKMEGNEKYKSYKQYEEDPSLVMKHLRAVTKKLNQFTNKAGHLADTEGFYLLNHAIPAEVASVLFRDYFEHLSLKDALFCKKIVMESAQSSLKKGYTYQVIDGVGSAISTLPRLLDLYPEDTSEIRVTLLLLLFDEYPIGMMGRFNYYAINAVKKLWEKRNEDARALFWGYLMLKPLFGKLIEEMRLESHAKGIYRLEQADIYEKFKKKYGKEITWVSDGKVQSSSVENISDLDLSVLRTSFQLLPNDDLPEEYRSFVEVMLSSFATKLSTPDHDEKIDFDVKQDFLDKLAGFVLSSKKVSVAVYLQPFVDGLKNDVFFADFFKAFVIAAVHLRSHDTFWEVWHLFKEKVFELCKQGDKRWYIGEIVKSYLFATVPWQENVNELHTLQVQDKDFFQEVCDRIGHLPSTLYAISKLLNDVGSCYLDDGVGWLSKLLEENKNLSSGKLEENTIYYLENAVRKFMHKNREKIRRSKQLKKEVLIILDFLIGRGSVAAYILRESIL